MNNTAPVVAIISLVACLFLAVRGWRSRNLGFARTVSMGVIWAAIIAALALVIQRYTS